MVIENLMVVRKSRCIFSLQHAILFIIAIAEIKIKKK